MYYRNQVALPGEDAAAAAAAGVGDLSGTSRAVYSVSTDISYFISTHVDTHQD